MATELGIHRCRFHREHFGPIRIVALVKRLRAKLNHLQSLSPEFGVYEYSTGEKFAGRI